MSSRPADVPLKTSARAMSHASDSALPADFVAFLRPGNRSRAGVEKLTRQIDPSMTVYVHGYTAFAHGVRGEVQGVTSHGAENGPTVMRAAYQRRDPVVLASNIRTRDWYAQHGYQRIEGGPLQLPDGPQMWPMWRAPQPRADQSSPKQPAAQITAAS